MCASCHSTIISNHCHSQTPYSKIQTCEPQPIFCISIPTDLAAGYLHGVSQIIMETKIVYMQAYTVSGSHNPHCCFLKYRYSNPSLHSLTEEYFQARTYKKQFRNHCIILMQLLSSLMLARLPLTKQAGDSTKGSERMGLKRGMPPVRVHAYVCVCVCACARTCSCYIHAHGMYPHMQTVAYRCAVGLKYNSVTESACMYLHN
jgi:hypothetical protein